MVKRAVATEISADPASVISVIDSPLPESAPGFVRVNVRAASLNQHDLWSIKGVGTTPEQFPLGIGSDIAGVTDDGREVIVHSLVSPSPSGPGGELIDPRRRMLAEASTGGAAEWVLVPERNLIAKPVELDFVSAAILPTAWLTAYRMLFSAGGVRPGDTVLVQGAGGGVATALISLAAASGVRVWVAGRDQERLARARELGAHDTFESGARLPERVDLVLETVGEATFEHSLRSVRPGGRVVVAGATTGNRVNVDLNRIFLNHVSIVGTSLGEIEDLRALVRFVARAGIQPLIDSTFALDDAAAAVARLAGGEAVGKVVITP
ncbi:zinc-binding dehydrogenase [Microbacterium sp. A196]|uniref:zinc-binding dehydrogenase n=1 Tax=Microbacterium sp. A196 TaxID=3457320 RepID=UPI003FD10CF1